MQNKSSKKPILIFVAIIVIAALAYFFISGTPKDSSSLLSTPESVGSDATVMSTNILVLLNQISSLKIDPSIFKSPVYRSLVDHTVPVYEQNVGKHNPFVYSLPPKAK